MPMTSNGDRKKENNCQETERLKSQAKRVGQYSGPHQQKQTDVQQQKMKNQWILNFCSILWNQNLSVLITKSDLPVVGGYLKKKKKKETQ